MQSLSSRRPSLALTAAFTALVVAMAGTAYGADALDSAKRMVTGSEIRDNSLAGADVKNGSLSPPTRGRRP